MRRNLIALTISAISAAVYGRADVPVLAQSSRPAPAVTDMASCESLAALSLPTVTITLATVVPAGDFTPSGGTQRLANLPAFCRVAATLKPSPDSDIKIE